MDHRASDTHAHDIAKSYGFYTEPSDHLNPIQEQDAPVGEPGGSIKGPDVAAQMPSGSPQFATVIPPETPLEQLEKGDRVDVYKRGTGERALMYGMVHAVNVPFGEVHLESEHGLRSININDYQFVKLASAPDGMPGNMAGGQSGAAGW